MNLLFYLSLKSVPLGIAVALEFTGPLALALLSSRRLLDFVWIALAMFGIWLLLPSERSNTHLDPVGMAFALGAGGFILDLPGFRSRAMLRATIVLSIAAIVPAFMGVWLDLGHMERACRCCGARPSARATT